MPDTVFVLVQDPTTGARGQVPVDTIDTWTAKGWIVVDDPSQPLTAFKAQILAAVQGMTEGTEADASAAVAARAGAEAARDDAQAAAGMVHDIGEEAEAAIVAAVEAQEARDAAQTSAGTASSAAGTATTKAGEASDAASDAAGQAGSASAAAGVAEAAKLDAETALSQAQGARDDAQLARDEASAAQTAAATAQDGAEDARDGAAAAADLAAANANGFTGGTATALPPGSDPTVDITGTAPDRQINIGVPGAVADDSSIAANVDDDESDTTEAIRSRIATDIENETGPVPIALRASTAEGMDNETSVIGRAGRRNYLAKGQTVRPFDFDGDTEADAFQASVDYAIANDFKNVRFDEYVDCTAAPLRYQTIAQGGIGLTSMTLGFDGQSTSPIAATASPATMEAALAALSTIGAGNVSVIRSTQVTGLYVYTVEFQGDLIGTTTVLTGTPTGGTGTLTIKPSSIALDKVHWYDRDGIVFEGAGGGFIKNDAGFILTSTIENTGDLILRGLKVTSTSGAGAGLIDADKLLRINTSDNEFHNLDRILTQTTEGRWVQSYKSQSDKIIGGTGPALTWRECYDADANQFMCEDRAGGYLWNAADLGTIANRKMSLKGIIENCSGIPLKLSFCWGTEIDVYFEQNGGPTDPQIDLYGLATTGRQTGLTIHNCTPQQTSAQKASHVGAIRVGNNVGTDDWINSIGNVMDGGIMYEFASTSGLVYGSGDRMENAALLTYPGQESQYISSIRKSVTTANRPKSVRTGTSIGTTQVYDSTLSKVVTATAVGTKAQYTLRFTAGATTSGTLGITMNGTTYNVAVTAGDSLAQVRDKVVAALTSFFPTWRPRASSTNVVAFDALTPGIVSASSSFSAGGTGVTSDYFGLDVAGTDPTWSIPTAMLANTATLDFPSIPAQDTAELTITVTGAAVGDAVLLGPPSTFIADLSATGYVSATNTVTVRLANPTAAAIDPASATWRATIVK